MKSKTHRMMRPRAIPGWRSLVLSLTLLCLFATTTVLVVPKSQAAGQLPLPVTILQFGAIPNDGRDDTDAMQASADYLSAHPGTTLIYPPGVYNITRTLDIHQEHSGNFRDKAVVYANLSHVSILGVGAIIDVKGDFEKGIDHPFPPPNVQRFAEATTYAFNPFFFTDSSDFTLSGFEINGHVDQTTQSDKSFILVPRDEYGLWLTRCHDFVLQDLYIHHMLTDGILSISDHNYEIRRVTSANNERNALSLTGVAKNIEVVDSVFRDSGVLGTAPNSYPGSSPGAGVDIEPEFFPEGADWVPDDDAHPRSPGLHLAGNILFNRVRFTGNLGTQVGMAHGEASANVTVRNSFIQNAIGGQQFLILMGIAGGVVENSVLDTQKGVIRMANFVPFPVAQYNSSVFHDYLTELAEDPSPVARSIFRERQGLSSIVRGNTIHGQATLLLCDFGFPVLTIADNEFQGAQAGGLAQSENQFYWKYGYLFVTVIPPPDATWTPDANIERNRFFIPQTAPRIADPNHGYGDIIYQGVTHLAGNQYTTDGSGGLAFHVAYDKVGTVVNDRFPTNGSIIPIHGPIEFSEGLSGPYTLGPGGTLNLPQ